MWLWLAWLMPLIVGMIGRLLLLLTTSARLLGTGNVLCLISYLNLSYERSAMPTAPTSIRGTHPAQRRGFPLTWRWRRTYFTSFVRTTYRRRKLNSVVFVIVWSWSILHLWLMMLFLLIHIWIRWIIASASLRMIMLMSSTVLRNIKIFFTYINSFGNVYWLRIRQDTTAH